MNIDFTRSAVKDLHSRVLVSVQKIDFISKKIEDLRDENLQLQLDELVGCFTWMWATMLECHQSQCRIIKLASKSCSPRISFQSESQCQAAALGGAEKITFQLPKLDCVPQGIPLHPKLMAVQVREAPEKEEGLQEAKWR